MPVFYIFLLCAALAILSSQVARLISLQKIHGEDWADTLCFLLMVPMTVSPLLHNPAVKIVGASLAVLCSVFFLTRAFSRSERTRSLMHVGMSLGMAAMYLAHHNFYVKVIFSVFYLGFSLYYFRDLLKFRILHSKFSHLLAGLTMLAMFFKI